MSAPTRRPRRCPVPGCAAHADPGRLMCRWHWSKVSGGARSQVWAAWHAYQREARAEARALPVNAEAAAARADGAFDVYQAAADVAIGEASR